MNITEIHSLVRLHSKHPYITVQVLNHKALYFFKILNRYMSPIIKAMICYFINITFKFEPHGSTHGLQWHSQIQFNDLKLMKIKCSLIILNVHIVSKTTSLNQSHCKYMLVLYNIQCHSNITAWTPFWENNEVTHVLFG